MGILYDFLSLVLRVVPRLTPLLCNIYIDIEASEGVGKWYDVYDSGTPKKAGVAAEWAVPLQVNLDRNDTYTSFSVWPRNSEAAGTFTMDVMQRAIETADAVVAEQEEYSQYLSSPVKLRFVKESDSYLSMMNGAVTG